MEGPFFVSSLVVEVGLDTQRPKAGGISSALEDGHHQQSGITIPNRSSLRLKTPGFRAGAACLVLPSWGGTVMVDSPPVQPGCGTADF
jgi:hypothetical protein